MTDNPKENKDPSISFSEYIGHLIHLHQKASRGPWETSTTKPMTDEEKIKMYRNAIKKGKLKTIQGVWLPGHPKTVIGKDETRPIHAMTVCTTGDGENSFHNSNFIAAARDAIPRLIRAILKADLEINRLNEENAKLKKEISDLRDDNYELKY